MTVGEIGVKTVLFNRSLVLNAAAFYGDYTDIQVSTFTSYDSDGDGVDDAFFGNFLNAGDATIKGFELEYNWSSRSFFGLSGFLAYLDTDPDVPRRGRRRLRRHPGDHERARVHRIDPGQL